MDPTLEEIFLALNTRPQIPTVYNRVLCSIAIIRVKFMVNPRLAAVGHVSRELIMYGKSRRLFVAFA